MKKNGLNFDPDNHPVHICRKYVYMFPTAPLVRFGTLVISFYMVISLLYVPISRAAFIYLSDPGNIYGYDRTTQVLSTVISGLSHAGSLSFANNRIYWVDGDTDARKINSASISGADFRIVVSNGSPHHIATDPLNNKLYWSDNAYMKIRSSNLDGTSIKDLATTNQYNSRIAIDPIAGKIYWTDQDDLAKSLIKQANLDGSDVSNLIIPGTMMGYDIAIDHSGGALFSATCPPATYRHSLDTGETIPLTSGWWIGRPGFITVDDEQHDLLMAVEGRIWSWHIQDDYPYLSGPELQSVTIDFQGIAMGPSLPPLPADDITMLVPYPAEEPNDPNDTRIPLILVHGIHGTEDFNGNGKLDDWEAVEQPAGWDKFLKYFDNQQALKNKYKVYRFLYLSDKQPVQEIGRSFKRRFDEAIAQGIMNDLPVVILAHSMGGLVSRSLMQEHAGDARIKKLITLATPHHGSPGANSTQALSRLFADGQWHAIFAITQLFYNLTSAADGSTWDVTIDSKHANRSDLRWDNKVSPIVGRSDANSWLAALNDSLTDDQGQKIIAYYGYMDALTPCRQRWGDPDIISANLALIPFKTDHAKLCIGGAIMDTGLNYRFSSNDGMVPTSSGRLNGHKVAKRVTCPAHDHLHMLAGNGSKTCSTNKTLFNSLKADLLNIASSP